MVLSNEEKSWSEILLQRRLYLQMSVSAVTVFCGASDGVDPRYTEAARALGQYLGKNKIHLIYGGGNFGLMGILAEEVLKCGGEITGFLPEFFLTFEDQRGNMMEKLGKTVIVEDMHTRKRTMLEKADALITLPGGFGTLEELLEMITWFTLGLHNKPIGILNVANYYHHLLAMFDYATDQGFIGSKPAVPYFSVAEDCESLMQKLTEVIKSTS